MLKLSDEYAQCVEAYTRLLNLKLNVRTRKAAELCGVTMKEVEEAEAKYDGTELSERITEIEN